MTSGPKLLNLLFGLTIRLSCESTDMPVFLALTPLYSSVNSVVKHSHSRLSRLLSSCGSYCYGCEADAGVSAASRPHVLHVQLQGNRNKSMVSGRRTVASDTRITSPAS